MNGINPKIKDDDDIELFDMKDIIIYVADLRARQKLQVERRLKLEEYRQQIIKLSTVVL